MSGLEGRVALVTGGGRGIGRACARDLARAGARVAVAARSRDQVDAAAQEIGGEARGFTVDVANTDSVAALFEAVRAAVGAPDILVSAAGIAPSALVTKTTDDEWHQAIETNLSGAFYCLRAALPAMLDKGRGRVVHLASIAGKTGYPYIGAYAASKHGLLGLTKCAALEVAGKGDITVNAVCPGYVDTPMTDVSIARVTGKTGLPAAEVRKRLEGMSPQKRLYTADEVAALVLFLCGDAAGGINGQALSLDGGTYV
ncbi:MAG TPA: SDR family NAD(P)-dependent oxidoreductase [Vicinamibacteria bacterium]|nr:SDR family NAD(P)-dependent oxidoreductase [Vicinamibacteria bacterium]